MIDDSCPLTDDVLSVSELFIRVGPFLGGTYFDHVLISSFFVFCTISFQILFQHYTIDGVTAKTQI